MASKVFSIIVTFNPCISDLRNNLLSHVETSTNGIVVVDNNSSNKIEIEELLDTICSEKVILLEFLDCNAGIGVAQNKGIEIAKNYLCSHIILFDQDTFVPNNILSELLQEEEKLLNNGIRVGAIGPIYRDPRTNSEYPLAVCKGLRLEKVWPSQNLDTLLNVSFIIASGSLIRLSIIEEVGNLNEKLFIDLVDIEWCFRAASKGYQIFATSNMELIHSIGDERVVSLGREISIHSPLRRYYMVRNNLLMSRFKWVPLGYRIRMVLGIIFRAIRFLFVVKWDKDYTKHILKGIWDGIKNQGGAINYGK